MKDENIESDSEMAELAREGSELAFRVLFERYYGAVRAYAYRLCHDLSLADDITQQTFIKMAKSMPTYQEKDRFKPWIFRIALNTTRDALRSSRRYQEKIEVLSGRSKRPEVEGQMDLIHEWLEKLPKSIREAFLLVHGWGFTHREAAAELDCPEGTIAWRISEARNIFSNLQSSLLSDENRP